MSSSKHSDSLERDSMVEERIPRVRTVYDKSICLFNVLRYALTEPLRVLMLRHLHESRYLKESEPLISVYIPTYNRAQIITERAIPSVLAQTYSRFELVIIGDCCTDNTEALVKKINDPRIRYYALNTRANRYPDEVELHWLAGPVVAANTALSLLEGSWIARLDDDDYWTTDHLEALISFAIKGNYEFVSAQCEFLRNGVNEIHTGTGALDPYYTGKPAPPMNTYNPKIGATQTWLYRSYLKCMKYNIHCWRKSWNRVNDLDLAVRIFNAGVRIGFLEQVVASVKPRPGENTVGIDAYKENEEHFKEHFAFR